MQSGELIVVGKDKAIIYLHFYPSKVLVNFEDECVIMPCNPHHHDSLEWELHHPHHAGHHNFTLEIKWHVTGVREIKWIVYY